MNIRFKAADLLNLLHIGFVIVFSGGVQYLHVVPPGQVLFQLERGFIYRSGAQASAGDQDGLFIHIIPQQDSTEILIGYHNNHTSKDMEEYVISWKGLGMDEIGYKLTDLFVAHVEDWGMSPRMFEKISEDRFEKFFELQVKYTTLIAEQKTNVGYNLFEGLL